MTIPPGAYFCAACAASKGGTWPDGHAATWHFGECASCRVIGPVAHWTDWRWPGKRGRDADAGRE